MREMEYFAYGANMNLEHMRTVCRSEHFQSAGCAYVEDHEFGFDENGFANLRQKDGARVWGVLLKIDEKCLATLDYEEDFPEDYAHRILKCIRSDGESVEALVYEEKPERFGGRANKIYLEQVIKGAREHHLPKEWISYLESCLL